MHPSVPGSRRRLRRLSAPSLWLEPLEPRRTLSAMPLWSEQGPRPGQGNNNPYLGVVAGGESAGAVNGIAVNPTNADEVMVATVNGGVWRGTGALAGPAGMSWTPLTDRAASLAIGDVAFSPADPSGRTIYAGTGQWSNHDDGGLPAGILKSVNAGVDWSLVGAAQLTGLSIRRVVPTTDPRIILVAAFRRGENPAIGGVYRSVNGGDTFAPVAPLTGAATDLVADPKNAGRFYAAIAGKGIFRSDTFGDTWTRIDDVAPRPALRVQGVSGATNIRLAVGTAGTGAVIYAGIVNARGVFQGVFRATIPADARPVRWQSFPTVPGISSGSQGDINFAITVDPGNANLVYVAGDAAPNVFRGNAVNKRWQQLSLTPSVTGSGPHSDARALAFVNGALWSADDGGVYGLTHPQSPVAGRDRWVSMMGGVDGRPALGAYETFTLGYDPVNRVFAAGSQDNSFAFQSGPDGLAWTTQMGGDGNTIAVDAGSASPNVIRYGMGNNWRSMSRFVVNSRNAPVRPTFGPIEGITNSRPIEITSRNHGLVTGDRVAVFSVRGRVGISAGGPHEPSTVKVLPTRDAEDENGVFRVTVVDGDRFRLDGTRGTDGGVDFVAGGYWERIAVVSRVAAPKGKAWVITSPDHRLDTGDQVAFTGTGRPRLDGQAFYVTRIDADRFSLDGTVGNGVAWAGRGTWKMSARVLLKRGTEGAAMSGLNRADRAFNGFQQTPYVLNSVDPRRMLLGLFGVYEDSDTDPSRGLAGDVIQELSGPRGSIGLAGDASDTVTALAYGGRKPLAETLVDQANVAFVGTMNGDVFFRGQDDTTFTNVTAGGLGQIRANMGRVWGISPDPQDWRRVYVLIGKDEQRVYMTDDITTLAVTPFRDVTDNLDLLAAGGQLRSLTLFDDTPTVAGDSIPLVGGLGDVFRRVTSGGDAGGRWSVYGQDIPNALVMCLMVVDQNVGGGRLAAATLGRGVWTIGNVASSIRDDA